MNFEKEEKTKGDALMSSPLHLHGLAFSFWKIRDYIQKPNTFLKIKHYPKMLGSYGDKTPPKLVTGIFPVSEWNKEELPWKNQWRKKLWHSAVCTLKRDAFGD